MDWIYEIKNAKKNLVTLPYVEEYKYTLYVNGWSNLT